MKLKDFVSQAIRDIVGGVQDAQSQLPQGSVVPAVRNSYKSVETGISDVTSIQFDVTVSADERKGSEAKLNVVAAIVGGSVKGDSGSSSSYAAKLSFRVPVKFPQVRASDT